MHAEFSSYVPTYELSQKETSDERHITIKRIRRIEKRQAMTLSWISATKRRAMNAVSRIEKRRATSAVSDRRNKRDARCTPSRIALRQKRRAMYAVSRIRTGRAMNAVLPNVMTIQKGTRDERRLANQKETSDGRRLGISGDAV